MRRPWIPLALWFGCGSGMTHQGGSAGHPPDHSQHRGDGMSHRFDNAEQWAKVFDDPARDVWQQPEQVIAALELSPAMVIADIGAGTGYFTMRLAKQVPRGQVIATDIEPDMVRYLKDRASREGVANVRAELTPPADPKLAEASLDRVLVVDVWHHLGDRIAYAKALARSLKPGGRIAVVDFKLDAKQGPPKEHRLAPEAIIADFVAAGLHASVAPTQLSDQYIVIARR